MPACAGWIVGVVVGLLFTQSTFFTGPLAKGLFASTNLGYLLGAAVGIVVFLVLRPFFYVRKTVTELPAKESAS